jgi:hypothetical protein
MLWPQLPTRSFMTIPSICLLLRSVIALLRVLASERRCPLRKSNIWTQIRCQDKEQSNRDLNNKQIDGIVMNERVESCGHNMPGASVMMFMGSLYSQAVELQCMDILLHTALPPSLFGSVTITPSPFAVRARTSYRSGAS